MKREHSHGTYRNPSGSRDYSWKRWLLALIAAEKGRRGFAMSAGIGVNSVVLRDGVLTGRFQRTSAERWWLLRRYGDPGVRNPHASTAATVKRVVISAAEARS